MKEKSQLEEMRAAVRGDIERARARREADPWRAEQPLQASTPERLPESEPAPAPPEEPAVSEGVSQAPPVPAEPVDEPVDEVVELAPAVKVETPQPKGEPEVDTQQPGFLSRLFGRG